MATLTVGWNGQYATIAAAVAAAQNGDTVSVAAGTYANDVATVRTNISLVASGGQVVLLGTNALAPGGALLTVAANLTITGFVFAGAHSADGSAAGLLQTAGALTVRNSLFTGNQAGLVSTAGSTATVSVQGSEFAGNGNGSSTGNIAVSAIQSLSIANSYIHDAAGGDEVRSLAHGTTVTGSRIEDNAAAAATALDLPNGGTVSVQNSVLQKGANSTAAAIIRFGGGTAYAGGSLSVGGNTAVADKAGALLVQNSAPATAAVNANQLWGFPHGATSGLAVLTSNTQPAARPTISTAALIPYSPGAPTQYGRTGAVVADGTVLTVGPGGAYATLGAALAVAHNGDTINVAAGTYAVAPTTVAKKVIIEGVGGLASFTAAPTATTPAALFTTTADVTFRNIEISGAAAQGGSEAAIDDVGANLTVVNSTIHGNQAGIVASGAAATVGIYDTELAANGTPNGAGGNVAAIGINTLTLSNDDVHDAVAGPEVSSTAAYTSIDVTRISQADGNGAADVLLPNGGQVTVTNSAIEKGAAAQPTPLVQVGGGTVAPGSNVTVANTTLISDEAAAPTVFVSGDPAVATTASNDVFVGGIAGSTQGLNATVSGATAGSAVAVNTTSPWTRGVSATGIAAPPSVPLTVPVSAAGVAERGVLILDMSGAAYQGNAQFHVFVDGVETGGTLTASADHAAGQSQSFTVGGTFAPGPHTVQVALVNALSAGVGTPGRTLTVDGAQFNGQPFGQATTLVANGTTTLFTGTVAPTPTAVTVNLSEDAWHGDAMALVTVDGKVQDGIQTVTAPHAQGQTEPFRFLLNLAAGPHTMGVTFINDASSPAGDRNLYVDSVNVAGQNYGSPAALLTGGTSRCAFTVSPPSASANANLFVTAGLPQAASLIVPPP